MMASFHPWAGIQRYRALSSNCHSLSTATVEQALQWESRAGGQQNAIRIRSPPPDTYDLHFCTWERWGQGPGMGLEGVDW